MKSRPILFSTPMVQALLNGSKTMTRRKLKRQPERCELISQDACSPSGYSFIADMYDDEYIKCKYGEVGDLLWVRETWKPDVGDITSGIRFKADNVLIHIENSVEAADKWLDVRKPEEQFPQMKDPVWRPSIFMPRWASRITLEITDVVCERLQDISEEDSKSEGVFHDVETDRYHYAENKGAALVHARGAFSTLWKSINGEDSWRENPWVWVVKFDVHNVNVDDFMGSK